jgi:hypothetical protein
MALGEKRYKCLLVQNECYSKNQMVSLRRRPFLPRFIHFEKIIRETGLDTLLACASTANATREATGAFNCVASDAMGGAVRDDHQSDF